MDVYFCVEFFLVPSAEATCRILTIEWHYYASLSLSSAFEQQPIVMHQISLAQIYLSIYLSIYRLNVIFVILSIVAFKSPFFFPQDFIFFK